MEVAVQEQGVQVVHAVRNLDFVVLALHGAVLGVNQLLAYVPNVNTHFVGIGVRCFGAVDGVY